MNAPGRLDSRESLRLLARALRYLAPFRGAVAVKLGFGALSLLPILMLPWPVKILVDRVIKDLPLHESPTPWPPALMPLIDRLAELSPEATLYAVVGFQALLLVLVGAIGTSSRENDQAEGYLSGGHDTATRTENEANAGFSLAGGLFGYLDFRWTIRLSQALNHHYRSRLFQRIQSLPMSAFDDERIGDAVYRVMYDTPSITNSCFRIALTPALSLLMILTAVWMLDIVFGAHPRIVWAGLAMLPLALLGTLPFAALLRRQGTLSRETGATTTSTAEEGLTNVLAVQSLGGEERERARFDRDSWASFRSYRTIVRTALLTVLFLLVPWLLLVGDAVLYSIDLVIDGQISLGDFGLFVSYFFIIAGAAVEIGAMWIRLQTSAAGLQRVFWLMDWPGEEDPPGAEPLSSVRQGVELDRVSYAFPDGTQAVDDVSFRAPVGRVTALVGPAGAGKTTLAYLLCGYHQPSRGQVRVDGTDLSTLTRRSLRDRIAFVFQETALFDDSVEGNIRLGRPDATDLEVRQAARRAGADRFVQDLPDGYRTRLGRGGGKLSVGQKQRLAIARALVREAPILVLDEPTSALDPETERQLVDSLRDAAGDRLVLVIAHRLSTVRAADQILFVDGGRIVERGSHEELMAGDGPYRRFVELQERGVA